MANSAPPIGRSVPLHARAGSAGGRCGVTCGSVASAQNDSMVLLWFLRSATESVGFYVHSTREQIPLPPSSFPFARIRRSPTLRRANRHMGYTLCSHWHLCRLQVLGQAYGWYHGMGWYEAAYAAHALSRSGMTMLPNHAHEDIRTIAETLLSTRFGGPVRLGRGEALQDSSSVQMCLPGLGIGLFCYMQLTSRGSLQPRNRCADYVFDLFPITILRVRYTLSTGSPYAWPSVRSSGCTTQRGFWASRAPAVA